MRRLGELMSKKSLIPPTADSAASFNGPGTLSHSAFMPSMKPCIRPWAQFWVGSPPDTAPERSMRITSAPACTKSST